MKNFFISYNKADKDWSAWIDWQLRSQGYSTFVQFSDIPWGSNFIVGMHEGLKNAERVILVVSPDSLESGFVKREWSVAMAKDPDGSKGLLLPIRVRDCDPAGLLQPQVYLDLVGHAEAAAADILTNGIAGLGIAPTGKAAGGGPRPTHPLSFDFWIEYVDSDQEWVNALIAKLEARKKRVYREIWKRDAAGSPTRINNPPAGIAVDCRVVCAGDATPAAWADARIQAIQDLQDFAQAFRFIPVVLGGRLVALREHHARVRFWAEPTNAESLLIGAATAAPAAAPPIDDLTQLEAHVSRFLQFVHEQQPHLDPAVATRAQQDALNDLRQRYARS